MTGEQMKKAANWIMKKCSKDGKPAACSTCGQVTAWGVQEQLVQLPTVENANAFMPLVAATCSNCAHVVLFSAHEAGLM